MKERLEYFSDEILLEFGEVGYQYYENLALNSAVPEYFFDVSKAYLFQTPNLADIEPKDIGKLLFNFEFGTNMEAWIAINYAQAIAIVKKVTSEMNTDIDSKQMLIGVGVAAMLEERHDENSIKYIKEKVENIFSDPRESLRINKMYEDMKTDSSIY